MSGPTEQAAAAARSGPGRGLLVRRLSERLGRSSRVFLIGLLCACTVQAAVDWRAIIHEIDLLRRTLRQKGENYADILRKASEGALLGYDWEELDRLSTGLFDDPEVVYVRFVDVLGNTLYDRLQPDYGRRFLQRHKEPFRAHYRHVMERDMHGIMSDPAGLRRRMQSSRHRDFVQVFTDHEAALQRRLSGAGSGPLEEADAGPPRLMYQDRLADSQGRLDRDLTYALGAILSQQGTPYGAVLIAFSNDNLNRASSEKLLRGLVVTAFFVCLILVQNVLSRRTKLRLLDLEQELAAARIALSAPQRGAGPEAR